MPGNGRWRAGASQKTCSCKPKPLSPTREEGGLGVLMPGNGRWRAGACQNICSCEQPPSPTRGKGGVGTATTDTVILTMHATRCSSSSLPLVMSTQRAGALRCGMTGSPRDRRSARLRQCHVKARRGAACRAPTGNDGTCGVSSWRRRTRLATALGRPVPIRGYIRAYRSVTPLPLRLPKRQTRVRATSTPALPPGAPAAPCPASL